MEDLPAKPNLKPNEIREFLNCSLSQVYQLIREGSIPAFRRKNFIRIPRAAFIEWYRDHIKDQG